MKNAELQKLMVEPEHFRRGGLPDVGKPHKKSGYRWMAGFVLVNGKPERWRENLGHDLLFAQYIAKAMSSAWLNHVLTEMNAAVSRGGYPAGMKLDMAVIDVKPMDRQTVKAQAWAEAMAAMKAPAKIAAQINQLMHDGLERTDAIWSSGTPAVSPGFKLVAVPVQTSPADVIDVAAELEAASIHATPTAMLHDQSRRWSKYLEKRLSEGTASDSYVERGQGVMKVMRKVITDRQVQKLDRQQLEEIRHKVQHNPKKDGSHRVRDTVRTELQMVRSFFQWMIDEETWTPVSQWQRWLRADFRSSIYDEDGQTVKRYSIDELAKMYAASGNTAKLYILSGLNFSWGAKEQATALKKHFKDDGQRSVRRYRNKRHPGARPVLGRWIAWPETWQLAKLKMDRTTDDPTLNPRGLAFMSVQNQPLVRYVISKKSGKKRRESVIDEAISKACKKAGVQFRGVYALRKTGINLMRNIGGRGMAKLYCQHRSKMMIEKSYLSKRWRKMWKALEQMRVQLQPMFDGNVTKLSLREPLEVKSTAA